MNTREDFEKYCKEIFGPITETASFEERIGAPNELPAVIGLISIHFSRLEETLSQVIIGMLQLDQDRGHIVAAELSFKQKVNMFSSLYINLKERYFFNTFPGFENEYFVQLVKGLNKCEELRNQVMHSIFMYAFTEKEQFVLRKKITAKQKIGLRRTQEKTDIMSLFNISDYIVNIELELEEFQINMMKPKDHPLT